MSLEKKMVFRYLVLALIFIGLFYILIEIKNPSLLGFAVFDSPGGGGDFDEGVYSNTGWDGSAVVLLSGTSGEYTSKIFDAGNDAVWNSLDFVADEPEVEFLYGVDGGGDVYSSSDSGITWIQRVDNYGRTTATQGMFSDSNYLYIIVGSLREVWRSSDLGVTWEIVNESFTNSDLKEAESDDEERLYVVQGDGFVWKSIDYGVTWSKQGDFEPENTNDARGVTFIGSDLYVINGNKDVFTSSDQAATWAKVTDDYGGGAPDDISSDGSSLYILRDKQVWKSVDSGITWNQINSSAFSDNGMRMQSDSSGDLYVLDTKGRCYKSTDFGISWIQVGDMNSGDINPKGFTKFIGDTNLSFQVRNCSQSDCSDGTWQDVDLNNLNLIGRYFQYRVDFSSPDSTVSPSLESISLDYDLVNTAPVVTLLSPQDGEAYGYNESLYLGFSVSDEDDNIDSCWYVLNSESPVDLPGCENTTIDVPEGSNTLFIYANDTLNLEESDSATFSVVVGAPSITLHSPVNSYLNYSEITFRYTPSDLDLESCELWGNFDGTWKLNQTENSPVSGAENTFLLSLDEGDYLWNVRCNDSIGNSAFNGNKTFHLDWTSPSVTLSEPIGTKTSRTGIPLVFSVIDNSPVYCRYNVVWATGGSVILNTSVANCSSARFSVATDGDYVLNLYINDSVNNKYTLSSGFSVSTSPPPGGGGSSGSSRDRVESVVVFSPKKEGVTITSLGEEIMRAGERRVLSLSIRNTGNLMQNNCNLKVSGVNAEWVSIVDEERDLNANEKSDFIFSVDIPGETEKGEYLFDLLVSCQDFENSSKLRISVIDGSFSVLLKEIKDLSGAKISLVYDLKELSGENQEFNIFISGRDEQGFVILDINETVNLDANEEKEIEKELTLPADSIGLYDFIVSASSNGISLSDSQSIVLGGRGIGGFAALLDIKPEYKRYFSIFMIVVLAGLLGFVVYIQIKKTHKHYSERKGIIKVKD